MIEITLHTLWTTYNDIWGLLLLQILILAHKDTYTNHLIYSMETQYNIGAFGMIYLYLPHNKTDTNHLTYTLDNSNCNLTFQGNRYKSLHINHLTHFKDMSKYVINFR